jgi:phosphate transport system substrate-binding protein
VASKPQVWRHEENRRKTMRKILLLGIVVLVLLPSGCDQPTASTPSVPTDTPALAPTETPTVAPLETPTVATPTEIPTPAVKPDLKAIAQEYPKVDGSTSAHPLQVVVACEILDVPCVWQPHPFTGVRMMAPDLTYQGPPQPVETIFNIIHNGTHGSYMNLIEGSADLILVARSPSEDELNAAEEKGVMLDVRAVALDAFVFLLNVENPVGDLTIENVRDIYTGEITDWAKLGAVGDAAQIQPYQRNPNSGSQELMEALVMKGTPMIDAPEMILESMMGPIHAIADDRWGIGYSVYYYAMFIFPHEQVKLIAIDGVEPTSDNIAKRSYPLTTEVYAVVREGMPEDSTAIMLRNWLLTKEGQAAIAESGYVPLP